LSPYKRQKNWRLIINKLKYFNVPAFAFVFLALATHSFGYQAENRISLMATPQHPGATGAVVITDTSIEIEARGLKADSSGNGTYSAELSESPFGKWEMIMVVLHPTGDPKDMKSMVGALSAGIK
jgi:hypothetical protein